MHGFYVHIPFCKSKCPYCDFVSGVWPEHIQERYLNALTQEIKQRSNKAQPSIAMSFFDTLYIGGGTPTALNATKLTTIIAEIFEGCNWDISPEVTVEANPGTVTKEALLMLKDAGVTRLSIGVQSLSNKGLRQLGRQHDVRQAVEALELAKTLNFSSVSMDLIYGWHDQTLAVWKEELLRTIEMEPHHISAYELTIEKGTPLEQKLHSGALTLPDEELREALTDATEDMLNEAGYIQYEISNFAKKGHFCRHNLKYWQGEEYVGVGVSAVSYLGQQRIGNVTDILKYISMIEQGIKPVAWQEHLDKRQRLGERMMLGLRMTQGVELTALSLEFDMDVFAHYADVIKRHEALGLLQKTDNTLSLTRKGRRLANIVLAEMV